MIIDADTHFLPPDTYDHMGKEWDALRPRFQWDDKGMVTAYRHFGLAEPARTEDLLTRIEESKD